MLDEWQVPKFGDICAGYVRKMEDVFYESVLYVSNTVNKVKMKVSVCAVYKATRLGSSFNIKDKINFEHQHNVVYHAVYPNRKCT